MATTKSLSPNKKTQAAMNDARKGKTKKFDSVDALMKDLNTEDTAESGAITQDTTPAPVATKKETKHMSDVPSVFEYSEDISNAEAPVPLPVGDYPAEIRAAERKTSSKGNDYAAVQFFIAPEAYPADYSEGEPDGMILTFMRIGFQDTPAGRHRMRKFTEAIGAPGGTKVDVNDWIGRSATVSIVHDEYEGEKRAAIAKVTAA